MRHLTIKRLGTLGVLICTMILALAACENEPPEQTGLEIEEREIERDDGQIEEAEIELNREEVDEIDRPADDELVEAIRDDEAAADEADQQPDPMQAGQPQGDELADQQQPDQQPADQQQADQQQADQQKPDQQQQDMASAFIAPQDYVGVSVTGEATVADVVSDRGFWLTDGQNRMFTVVREYDEKIDINEGQRVRVSGIMVASADPSDVTGELDAQTKRVIDEQDAFVVASWRDIEFLDQPDDAAVGGGPDDKQEQEPMEPQHNLEQDQ